MSFLLSPESTIALLEEVGFYDIQIMETSEKYISGYEKMINNKSKKENPILGIHVIGGATMKKRSKNSMQCIKEKRTLPFEIVCKK